MNRILKERTFSGTTNPEVQSWELDHRQIAREAAAEGIVLLKNEDNVLPLKSGSAVAIYGAGAGRCKRKRYIFLRDGIQGKVHKRCGETCCIRRDRS